ncbi:MAG: hypothetical protein AAGD35_17570, partial [Actinomycetota bacterium]
PPGGVGGPRGGSRGGGAGVGGARGPGPPTASLARVPLADVADEYARRATAAADRQELPANQRRLVGDYFDLLTE